MTKEGKALIMSMIINLFVSLMKVITGLISNSKSMVADGFHSLSDFITDIVAFFGSKLSHKRANQKYPDGYGRIEYVTDIFIALVIFSLGLYTIYNSFFKEPTPVNVTLIIIIIFTIILKRINSEHLMKKGVEYHSPILITSSKESHDDMISSIGVIIIIIISQFQKYFPILKYADSAGSFIIGILIIKTSVGLLKENITVLMGETEDNEIIKNKIKNILDSYSEIDFKNMELESHGSYYVLELDVYVLKNIKVYRLMTIESEIRRKIKNLHQRIKFIDINLSQKTEEENTTKE